MKRVKAAARKAVISIVGFTLVIVGIILIPLPGPGILVILAGLAVLATEFEKAEKLLNKFRKQFKDTSEKTKLLFNKKYKK